MKNYECTQEEKDAIFEAICTKVIEERMSFNQAVNESKISLVTFYKWICADDEKKNLYNYAREIRSDVLFEEIVEIADTQEEGTTIMEKPAGVEIKRGDMIEHRRLRVDARKWVAAKMNPLKYGDRVAVDMNAKVQSEASIKVEYNGTPLDLTLGKQKPKE